MQIISGDGTTRFSGKLRGPPVDELLPNLAWQFNRKEQPFWLSHDGYSVMN